MYLQRHGFCSFNLLQHSLDGGDEDEKADAHGASWVGAHVTAIETCDSANTRSTSVATHSAIFAMLLSLKTKFGSFCRETMIKWLGCVSLLKSIYKEVMYTLLDTYHGY